MTFAVFNNNNKESESNNEKTFHLVAAVPGHMNTLIRKHHCHSLLNMEVHLCTAKVGPNTIMI